MRRPKLLLAWAALLVAGLVAYRAPAEACSPPWCIQPRTAPASGQVIPENAGALVFFNTDGVWTRPEAADISLWTQGGAAVPLQAIPDASDPFALVLVPQQLVAAGGYELRHRDGCAPDGGRVVPFLVGPAAPLPTSAGALTAEVAREPQYWVSAGATCAWPVRAAVARLSISPATALVPFLPVTRWRVEVDGAPWANSGWGRLDDAGVPQPPGDWVSSRRAAMVHVACEVPSISYIDRGTSEGLHEIQVIAVLPDAGDLPPMSVSVELRCPWDWPDAGTGTDAGSTEVDGGEPLDAGSSSKDAGAPVEDAGTTRPAPPLGCGCSVDGAPIALCILALAGPRTRRRHRRPE